MRRSFWIILPALALSIDSARGAEPADVLDKAPSRFAKSGDKKVHYKSLGDGKTAIVFVHGWCCDLTVWREQAAAFNGKVRLLFVDLPGYGKSDLPKVDYTMALFAKGVDAVVEDAKVDRVVLVGHSMGTPVIREYYRLYPRKTQALVFVDGALRMFSTDPKVIENIMSMFKEETFKENAPKFLSSMLGPNLPAAAKEQIERMVANTNPRVAISSMRGMLDEKNWKEDPIKVPSQALMAQSPHWTAEYKEFVKKLVPDIDYREFEGVGHFLFMEKPAPFNKALGEFLNKQGVLK